MGVVVTDSQNNIISPAGGTLPLSIPDDARQYRANECLSSQHDRCTTRNRAI
ncbi:hypothetical protein HTZ85_03330 [Escherichia coli]|nr:hypothetical protein [Escherichia coli]